MKKLLFLFLSLTAGMVVNGQSELKVFTEWESTDGTQNFFKRNVTKADVSGNVYVVGSTKNGSGNYDILLAKYNSSGVKQWIQQYAGAGNGEDMGTGLYIDGSGNVYITGTVTTATNVDVITIKYNSSGTQQWVSTYDGTGSTYDSGADVVVDASGNVYVTGSSYNGSSNTDVITIKYNSSGTQQWATRYDYTAHLNDAGVKVSYSSNIVLVSVVVQYNTTTYKYGVLQYNATTGAITAGRVSSSSTTGIDQVNDMAIDASGNIYIAGATPVTGQGYNYDIIKLNSTLGIDWERTYNGGSSLDDIANGIVVDGSGNVYVTGYSTNSTEGKNIATIKYNSSGTQQWVEIYNDTLDGDDAGNSIVKDNAGDIIVTGYVTTAMDSTDYFTIKYNSSGTEQWSILSDGLKHMSDVATNIAIDSTGDIIVTGVSQTSDTTFEYRTVKFVEKEIITPTDYYSEEPAVNFAFYENHGQLINTSDTLIPEVKYYTNNTYPAYYFKDNSFSFVFAHMDTSASTTDTLQRIDVSFPKGGGADANTYPMDQTKDYLNYFLGHCPEGVTELHGNQKLVMPDVWPNVDIMYTSNQNGLKMYVIVKPGADTSDIRLDFEGASGYTLNTTNGALSINSLVGNLAFGRPTVYQIDNNNVVDTLTGWTSGWKRDSDTNRYYFKIGAYNPAKTLVIMVDEGHTSESLASIGNLEWSTYYGGLLDEVFLDVETDATNNSYVTGNTCSSLFPHNSGVLQTTLSGTQDAVVLKFDPVGAREFATYFGGLSTETGYSILPDNTTGNIFVVGDTKSSNMPIGLTQPAGAYTDGTLNGISDAFILELNPNGTGIIWNCYYGGSDAETFYSITEDHLNNIYISGYGTVNTPLMTQSSAYNNSSVGKGLLTKFTKQGERLWASLYVTGNGAVKCIKADNQNNFYITGDITTNGMPIYTPTNAYCDNSLGGAQDAFIAKFDVSNTIVWSTYLGGSAFDYGNALAISGVYPNTSTNVYVTGSTESIDFPTQASGYASGYLDNTKNGSSNTFISKFTNNGAMNWSTYHGNMTSGYDVGCDIIISGRDEVYVTGYTYGITTQILDGAYNQNTISNPSGSSSDAYLLAFTFGDCERIWSTYFGGSRTETGRAIALDQDDNLYMVGESYSTLADSYPLPRVQYTGAWWQPDNGGAGHNDGFISRFDLSLISYGVKDNQETGFLNVYPNPVSQIVNIEADLKNKEDIILTVYTLTGQKVLEKSESKTGGFYRTQLDMSGYNSGIYIVQLNISGKLFVKKLIKQ
ncbi:MAG: SBBP repeat-containing protein [Bacteroidota bacterium]